MQIFAPFMTSKKYRFARVGAAVMGLVVLIVLLAQTAMAQNTFVITDGDQVTVHTSFASDPEVVLNEAGVELDSDDFYTTAASGGVSEITVQRAQSITIDYCGETISTSSYGETLGDVLNRHGIQTYGNYTVSHKLDEQTFDGMQVRISNVVEAREVYTVELPAKTVYCDDPSLPMGQEKVLVEGSSGQILRTANVVYLNGQEQSRTVLEETVLEQPVDRLVAVGTGENTAGELYIGDGYIVLPTGEVLTYTYADTFVATAYTHMDPGCSTTTATGTDVHWGTVAVDPTVVPYGTRMFILTPDGSFVYGIGTAEDCGGGVKGKHVDLYVPAMEYAYQVGRQNVTIYFLGESEWTDW